MFGFRKKKKRQQKIPYHSIRLLYFNRPVDETVSMILDKENMTLELCWNAKIYVMSLDRLSACYYKDIYASLLAQGNQIFLDDWPVMKNLLSSEKAKREQENAVKNCDGIKIVYHTKEHGKLLCLITSEVLLYMIGIMRDLKDCIGNQDYQRIEL